MPSVTRGTRSNRERRAGVSQRILAATERLLRDGERYTEIPVERIISEAGVSRSTFYAHFPDKAALLVSLARRAVADVAEAADLWWRADHSRGIEAVEPTLRAMIKAYRKHAMVLGALGEAASYDENARGLWREELMRYADFTTRQIQGDQRDGRVAPDVDAELTAYATIHMIEGAIRDHIAHGPAHQDAELARALARAGWLAIYGQAAA